MKSDAVFAPPVDATDKQRNGEGIECPAAGRTDDMTKAELIEEVSRVVEMTRKDSEVIVEAIFDSIVRSLRGGDKIEIRGFGSFRTRQRQPRVGRNPKTGTRVEVPSKRIPYFKPSKELKDLVNTSSSRSDGAGEPPAPAAPFGTPEGAPPAA
jgi:integration host factor subunit beta